MKFIKLTGYKNKQPTWINPEKICSIDVCTESTNAYTCLYLDESYSVGVLETPEVILALLEDNSNNMQMNMSFPDIFGGKK